MLRDGEGCLYAAITPNSHGAYRHDSAGAELRCRFLKILHRSFSKKEPRECGKKARGTGLTVPRDITIGLDPALTRVASHFMGWGRKREGSLGKSLMKILSPMAGNVSSGAIDACTGNGSPSTMRKSAQSSLISYPNLTTTLAEVPRNPNPELTSLATKIFPVILSRLWFAVTARFEDTAKALPLSSGFPSTLSKLSPKQ